MSLPTSVEIIIIGGGVMGASTAYHLALSGQKDVLLLERNEFFGIEATGRCAGGVRYQFSTEINVQLSLKSLPMFESFKTELDQEIDYRKCGYLFVLTNTNDVDKFQRNMKMQNQLGVQTEWLTGDEIRRQLPLMQFSDALGGTFNPKDGLVDPNSVVQGYMRSAQRLGVKAISSCEVIRMKRDPNGICSVQTTQGEIACRTVINAAGPWAGQVGSLINVSIPITPIRRQLLTTSPIPSLPADFPFVIDFAQSLYFHREGSGILTGMSNEKEKPGFDQNIDPEFELINLQAAIDRMPILENAGLQSHWAGLYEVTPDAHPIFGRTEVPGFYIVAGFSGHGFMHGPVAGKLMAELILSGRYETLDVSALDLARFTEDRLIQEYNVV